MKPYYSHAGITIYHGDCREILPQLGSGSLLMTDLPYDEVNRQSGGLRKLDKGDADAATFTVSEFLKIAIPAFTGSAYVWCGTQQVSDLCRGFVAAELSTRIGFWEKSNPSPMNGQHLWLSSLECCVFAKKSGALFNQFCVSPVWRGPTAEETGHPTPKPEWLIRAQILASTDVGDLVIDPCVGGGTTLWAAKNLDRRAIGIEIEEKYCEIAAKRLAQDVLDFTGE